MGIVDILDAAENAWEETESDTPKQLDKGQYLFEIGLPKNGAVREDDYGNVRAMLVLTVVGDDAFEGETALKSWRIWDGNEGGPDTRGIGYLKTELERLGYETDFSLKELPGVLVSLEGAVVNGAVVHNPRDDGDGVYVNTYLNSMHIDPEDAR